MGVMDIGQSALNAAYTRLQTTSQNIANASTPGYSRQEVNSAALSGQLGPGGFIGGGVEITAIERQYNEFVTRELDAARSANAADQTRATALSRLDQLFSDSENGIGARYDAFNAGLADMVNQPFDEASRSVALQRARELANVVGGNSQKLETIATDTHQQASEAADQVNARLTELAALNGQIAGMGDGLNNKNTLLDRRDALIGEIGESIKASAHLNSNGTVSLFASTGDALVLAEKAGKLSVEPDERDPGRIRLNLQTEGGNLPLDDEHIAGGQLAGLISFYNEDLRDASARLGQMAGALTQAYNDQQAAGLDADHQPGAALFALGSPIVQSASANTGTAGFSVELADGSALKASDYSIQMTGGAMTLTRLSDGQQTDLAGLPQTIDGLTFNLDSGAMAEGDFISVRAGTAFANGFEVALQSTNQWANASPVIPVAGEGNTGSLRTGSFAVTEPGAQTTEPVTLTFVDANTFDVSGNGTGNPTGVTYTPGEPISFNGWTTELTGVPSPGDTLVIRPTTDPSADNRNARALLDLGEAALVDGRSLNESFSGLIGDVGARAQAANNNAQQSEIWLDNAQASRDSVSGVNLDEEAARLLQYQQAYQAAAKLISTAQNMFDSLISIGR